MKFFFKLIFIFPMCFSLVACNNESLKAPCPDFGAHCYKKPINSWNDTNARIF